VLRGAPRAEKKAEEKKETAVICDDALDTPLRQAPMILIMLAIARNIAQ